MKRIQDIIITKDLPIPYRTRSRKTLKPFKEPSNLDWISVTELNNFCQNDLTPDWCNVIRQTYDVTPSRPDDDAMSFLFEKGKEYEDLIINRIRDKTGMALDRHSSHSTSRQYTEINSIIDSKRVRESMARGDSIIYSAYLADPARRLRGIPDLLVRNDHIHHLFDDDHIEVEYGTSIFGNYYYIPVEIKFSTIHLNTKGSHVMNEGRAPFYKTQLYAYCSLLQTIQGWQPSCAFLIGKRTVHKDDVYNSISKPGYVDYSGHDISYISKFHEGLEWLRKVKKYGATWSLSDIHNFPPNMKIVDTTFQQDKKDIASISGEITEIWQCGNEQRQRAYDVGIYSWHNPHLTSKIMNVPPVYQNEVDKILQINRGELGLYHPTRLTKNTHDMFTERNEMFVDFETVRDTFDIRQTLENPEFIFLIGVSYRNKYRSFQLSELTETAERDVIMNFYQFWVECGKPRCWFWYAETELWKRAIGRHNLVFSDQIEWSDLYEVVRAEPFVVKGCKNFKLKSYVAALSNLSLIPLIIPPETCENGLDAMMIAWKYYKEDKNVYKTKMQEVISYNKFDCIALQHLLTFLRKLLN